MKSSYLTNLGLLLLVAALYWFNSQDYDSATVLPNLTDIDPGTINTIKVNRSKLDDISLVKIAGHWQLSEPLQARANPTRIELLLSLVTASIHGQLAINDHSDLSQYGIDADSTQLQFNQDKFQFGGVESISKKRYLLYKEQLYLIDDRIAPLLNANANNFIDNRLFAATSKIQKLQLPGYLQDTQIIKKTITVEQQQASWTSNQGHKADRLIKLIDAWQHAYATQVLPLSRISLQEAEHYPVKIWLENSQSAIDYQLVLTKKSVLLVDNKKQLAFQFMPEIAQQLLLESRDH